MEVRGRVEERRGRRGKTSPGKERGNETRKVVIARGSVEFCKATPIGLADESKESSYKRETDRDLRSAFVCRYVEQRRRARREGRGLPGFFFSLFPCSADHKRNWPPCKVVFWVGNPYAECEKQQQQLSCTFFLVQLKRTLTP